MAFTKIKNVKDEFRKLFTDNPVTIQYKDADKIVPVRYAVKSALDYTEELQQQVYPVISIYDRGITQSPMWNLSGYSYTANQSGILPVSEQDGSYNPVATQYYEPILLHFMFDVGIAAKTMLEHTEMEQYIWANFIYDYAKIFNKITVNDEDYGEPIALNVVPQKIPRNDGVHETNFDMTFDAWLDLKDPEDIQLIKTLNIIITVVPIPETI